MDLSSHPSRPWKALLLTASFLTSWSLPGDTQLAIYPRIPIAVAGQDVLLSVHGIQRESRAFSWFQGLDHQNLILSYNISSKIYNTGPGYTGREVLYENASLLIRNVRLTDGRNYTFQEIRPDFSMATTSKELQVYKMVSKPLILANTSSITEAKGSVTFKCLTKDDSTTILWFLNNKVIPPRARLSLSKDNKTLTLLQTRREDAGQYQCEVWNQVSAQSSDHVTLRVDYGPDQVKITQEPGSRLVHTVKVKANSTLTLRCQAESHPSARYDWQFNGSTLVIDRENLTLHGESLVPGHYTCTAWNSLLKRFAAISVYIDPLMKSPDNSSSDFSHSSLTLASILVGILVVMALISVLVYLLRKKARGISSSSPGKETVPTSHLGMRRQNVRQYSQEVLGGPGQKEKNLSSMRNSDITMYENGLQFQRQPSNGQMVTHSQDGDPYSTLSPDSLEEPYQMMTRPQDGDPCSILCPDSLEDPYQKLTFASIDIYEQISTKEATQEKDEDLRD